MLKNNKPSMVKHTTSFITALSIVIGSVIGVGIFFKNNSMIAWAHGNGILVVCSWIGGSLIAIGSAIIFGLIAKKCKANDSGIGQYAQEIVGKRFGWHTKLTWAFFYFPWLSTVCSTYAADYIMKISTKTGSNGHTLLTMFITILLIVIFLGINLFSEKIGNIFQISTTWIKLIPLFILSIGVFIIVFIYPIDSSYWPSGHGTNPYDTGIASDTNNISSNPFLVFLFILPGTLFAFDSFLNVASLSETTKKKHLVFAIIGGMSFIAIIYILVTVAIIHTGTLTAEGAIIKLFGGNPTSPSIIFVWIRKIIRFIIVISAIGVVNGFAMVWIRSMKSVLKEKQRKNVVFGIAFAWLISAMPLILLTIIISVFNLEVDKKGIGINFINAISNPLTIISYSIYSTVILSAVYRNYMCKNKKEKHPWWFNIVGIFSSFSSFSLLIYLLFYSILYKGIILNGALGSVHSWIFGLTMVFYITIYLSLPFIIRKISPKYIPSVKEIYI